MKLKGSLTEQKFREELIASQRALFEQSTYAKLARKLREHFQNIRTAFILAWTPDQLEDIFDVLVDGEQVISLEYLSLMASQRFQFSPCKSTRAGFVVVPTS